MRVLLLHGVYAGAGPHEWRALLPCLPDVEVVAPDLAAEGEWDAERLTAVVGGHLDDADAAVVVGSSLTGAHVLRAVAAGAPAGTVVLITPTGLGRAQRRPSGIVGRVTAEALRRTAAGSAVSGLLGSKASVSLYLRQAVYGDATLVTDEVVAEYTAAAERPGARDLALAFVAGRLAVSVDATAVAKQRPLVIWGPAQRFVGDEEPMRWRNAGADVRQINGTGLPHAERPELVAELILSAAGR